MVRLRDKDGAFLNAAQAIDVAERTGLITALDERVLEIACARAASWRLEPEHRDLRLNINRSVKDITRPGFYQRIMNAVAKSGLDPSALTVEITETVLLDATEENLIDLRSLAEHGIGLAIDDFGTGYASLRYLAELPITSIKLDRSFTQRAARRPDVDDADHGDHRPGRAAGHQLHGRGGRDAPTARRAARLRLAADPGLPVCAAAERHRPDARVHLHQQARVLAVEFPARVRRIFGARRRQSS